MKKKKIKPPCSKDGFKFDVPSIFATDTGGFPPVPKLHQISL